jgi:hypothetical protein
MDEFTTVTEAQALIGGLSNPGKMPGKGWSISARHCKAGSKLRQIDGSVCNSCYACKGHYSFEVVQHAQERRQTRFKRTGKAWIDLMVKALERETWFRWLDSGDLQSDRMLERIIQVCELTPHVRHWLPTREYRIVKRVLNRLTCPPNLMIRLSAHMIDEPGPEKLARKYGLGTSTVVTQAWTCPARSQKNQCLECRKCWDPGVTNISYPRH